MQRRPSSAGRPRSAGLTRTRSYFDAREGKSGNDETEDVPAPLFHDDESEPVFSLLGNFDDDSVSQWVTTRTVKPKVHLVEDVPLSFGHVGIRNVCDYLTGDTGSTRQSDGERTRYLCQPSAPTSGDSSESIPSSMVNARSLKAHGPLGFLHHILVNYFWFYLINCFGSTKRDDNESSETEEDGLFVRPSSYRPHPGHHLRAEERIRREMRLERKPLISPTTDEGADVHVGAPDTSTPQKGTSAVKSDESFWASPGKQLVGPEKQSGNLRQEVEVSIRVEEIKFSDHPEFTAEERALCHVWDLYEQYRRHRDSNILHYSVSRLIEIFRRIRLVHATENEDSKETEVPMLEDLKSTSSKLITESDAKRNLSSRLKRTWKEMLSARESAGFTGVVVELKASPCKELEIELKRLVGEVNSTKPVLSQIHGHLLHESNVTSLQFLEDLGRTLTNTDDFIEQLELMQPDSPQPGWVPKVEKLRRRRLASEKYFARLLVNGTVVGDTSAVNLDWPAFSVKLAHRFNCKMSRNPTVSCVQVWKQAAGFLPDTLICTCFNNILGGGPIQSAQSNDEAKEGVSLAPVSGEWVQFSSLESTLQRRWKGSLLLSSTCEVNSVQQSNPTMAKVPRQDFSHRSKILIRPSLGGFVNNNILVAGSPNGVCSDRQSMMAFKLPGNGTLFSNKLVLEEPLRHTLIKRRRKCPNSFPSPLPITELMIQNNEVYQNVVRDESGDQIILGDSSKERALATIAKEIKDFTQRNECQQRHHCSDVIQDVGLFRFADDMEEMPFPARKRSLFPPSTPRFPQETSRSSSMGQTQLLVTVIGGKDVPIAVTPLEKVPRNNGEDHEIGIDAAGTFSPAICFEEQVGVFAKIKFRGQAFHTRAVQGPRKNSPQWGETVCLLLPTVQGAPTSPRLQDESIEIFLFDSSRSDLRHTGGFYEDEDTKMTEERYLGHISVPLMTILCEGTISGFVPCQTPCLVGYVKESLLPGGENDEGKHRLPVSEPGRFSEPSQTMIRIHATTEPLTKIPPKRGREFPSCESESVMTWIQQLGSRRDPEDCYSLLWPDCRGNSFLVSRFISEQAPPRGIDNLASCAHYVHLFPLLRDLKAKALPDKDDSMILSSQQFITIAAGNREEHALLLTNFFLYLSKKNPETFGADVFLARGFAIPEGKASWVVRRCRKTKEVVLYDASSGCSYSQSDKTSPLQKIDYLASTSNVYLNEERTKKPCLLNFDLGNSQKWFPLHEDENNGSAIVSIQEEALSFSTPDYTSARELQDTLRESIQNAVRMWRRSATAFRSDVASKLAPIIEKLEQAKLEGLSVRHDIILPESIMKTRAVFGFTLHAREGREKDVLDWVEATEIHRNRHPRAEFAVVVRAFPYPGGVNSLWVFICCLVPK
ncbi:hypothetical protein ACHAWF_012621 [Thalassiosira exigua]